MSFIPWPAIASGDTAAVRRQLLANRRLVGQRLRAPQLLRFDPAVELDAYKFLGAYVGPCTPLHAAILLGRDAVAADVAERCTRDELDATFGVRDVCSRIAAGGIGAEGDGGNTALHLAALYGSRELIQLLLERGATRAPKNRKGFAPVDVLDDGDAAALFCQ
ncbi:hypothetical protein HK405_010273 [Cladochytrium tenue]|nr:hypothetical protein HK405_010273 [Cladochytrium tenue]